MTSSSQADQPRYLLVGEILRPHGITGELRMRVLTNHPDHLADLKTVYLGKTVDSPDVKAYELKHVRMHQQFALLRLKTIDDRDQADRLRQLLVMIAPEDAVPLDEGELYLYQLIGLDVQTQDGLSLGKITEVLSTGANDVYIIQSPEHGEILIPATVETIISTDTAAGIIVVNLPDGLIPAR